MSGVRRAGAASVLRARCERPHGDAGRGAAEDGARGRATARAPFHARRPGAAAPKGRREAVAAEGWRMPTVDEAVSLLRPGQALGEFCHRPFGDRYLWLWTADRRSFTSAWFVDVGGAAVLAQDRTCRFHVRLVRSVQQVG